MIKIDTNLFSYVRFTNGQAWPCFLLSEVLCFIVELSATVAGWTEFHFSRGGQNLYSKENFQFNNHPDIFSATRPSSPGLSTMKIPIVVTSILVCQRSSFLFNAPTLYSAVETNLGLTQGFFPPCILSPPIPPAKGS